VSVVHWASVWAVVRVVRKVAERVVDLVG
jgi:hypothetical protein